MMSFSSVEWMSSGVFDELLFDDPYLYKESFRKCMFRYNGFVVKITYT